MLQAVLPRELEKIVLKPQEVDDLDAKVHFKDYVKGMPVRTQFVGREACNAF